MPDIERCSVESSPAQVKATVAKKFDVDQDDRSPSSGYLDTGKATLSVCSIRLQIGHLWSYQAHQRSCFFLAQKMQAPREFPASRSS